MWLFFPNQLNLSTKHIFSPSPPNQGHSRDGREKGMEPERQTDILSWDNRLDGNALVLGKSALNSAPWEPTGMSRSFIIGRVSGMGRQCEPEVLCGGGQELVPGTLQFICWLSAIGELEESAHHSTSSSKSSCPTLISHKLASGCLSNTEGCC